ncbi:MAG: DUF4926 domain-containing protein [Chloroflexi bacterium]|nr:DUF4926 domain-containing protein [Chloroflexota bacterium]
MDDRVPLHASVALLNDVQATHFEHGMPVVLHRGDVGTVVLIYGNGECEVEFAGRDGRTYALLPLPSECLLVLRDVPEDAVTARSSRSA